MCNETVGVVKRIDLENVSQKVANLVHKLDEEVSVNVKEVKEIEQSLRKLVRANS